MHNNKRPLNALDRLMLVRKRALRIFFLMMIALFALHGLWGSVRHANHAPVVRHDAGAPRMPFVDQGHP